MRSLSLTIAALTFVLVGLFSQVNTGDKVQDIPKSPHGKELKLRCDVCHSAKGWSIDKSIYSFNHNTTNMPLVGQHAKTDCKLCHTSLVFSQAKTTCADCHTDIHEATVGNDCARCHTPESWLVKNITKIHQQSRFPIVGAHISVDCYQCHKSETSRRFQVIGTECYNCHSQTYLTTSQPNHISVGYSTNCNECHSIVSKDWKQTGFNHNFFPLTEGHALNECSQCHTNGKPTKLSNVCASCHQPDFNKTQNPNHQTLQISTNCVECHTTTPGWNPAKYIHNNFALTQGHAINECAQCHINRNYKNTSQECYSCHKSNYTATKNPNHVASNFSTTLTASFVIFFPASVSATVFALVSV